MRTNVLALVGAGGHAAVVADAALAQRMTNLAIYSEDPKQMGQIFLGHRIMILERGALIRFFHVCIGQNQVRARLHRQLSDWGFNAVSIVHPAAIVSQFADVGVGCFIAAGAILAPRSHTGQSTIINHRAIVDHDVSLGSYCHIAPGVTLGGGVQIGDGVLVGAGTTILPGVVVGDNAIIGAGAVVLEDVPQDATVVGVPARRI